MPGITVLIMYLLAREARFERMLAKEHIEDILHDKRINRLTPKDMFKLGTADAVAAYRKHDAAIKPHLVEWQNSMRACFDYRMLRDWGYGRHWEKIFVVAEERPNSQAAIQMFKNWASNNSKLAHDMFSVHPIFKGEISDGDICTVCYCD
jgi:hypothetical protein